MTLRQALEKLYFRYGVLYEDYNGEFVEESRNFGEFATPIIERALRAAYDVGYSDGIENWPDDSDRGVTAGVAAMVEGNAPRPKGTTGS